MACMRLVNHSTTYNVTLMLVAIWVSSFFLSSLDLLDLLVLLCHVGLGCCQGGTADDGEDVNGTSLFYNNTIHNHIKGFLPISIAW